MPAQPDDRYAWQRFWCPRGERYSLSSEGYLLDPEQHAFYAVNTILKSTEQLTATPCLILLGEPGIGKSHELQKVMALEQARAELAGDLFVSVDLRSIGSEDRLHRRLLDLAVVRHWLACPSDAQQKLYLFLDSLDECRLRVATVAALLADEFAAYPWDRLRLRIACRTAEWPEQLEKALKSLATLAKGETACEAWIGVYELAVLRHQDVVMASEQNQIDATTFSAAVHRAGVVPFASKPVSLQFLLNIFPQHQTLPGSQYDLYVQGCRLLCDEVNSDRRQAPDLRRLDPDRRFVIAARIAALTQFSNKEAIFIGADRGATLSEWLPLADLLGDEKTINGTAFSITESDVRETLGTGLFTARGDVPGLMGWAHQTYAEFLAAWYLDHHAVTDAQVLRLITHATDGERALVPQLQEIASWLASRRRTVFDHLLQTDPEALLRNNTSALSPSARAALIQRLLECCAEKRVLPYRLDLSQLARLDHAGLSDQLQPYLQESQESAADEESRYLALSLTEACGKTSLQEDLVRLILDAGEPLRLRVRAARSLIPLGDAVQRARLRPLLTEAQLEDDPDDELRGVILECLWPDGLTADELFAALTEPKRSDLVGNYQWFVSHLLIPTLRPSDLPRAMRWVAQFQQRNLAITAHTFDVAMRTMCQQAWPYLDQPEVLDAFVSIALTRMNKYESVLLGGDEEAIHRTYFADEHKRRLFVEAVIQRLASTQPMSNSVSKLLSEPNPFQVPGDENWLLGQLEKTKSAPQAAIWSEIIVRLFNLWDDSEHFARVWNASQTNPHLAAQCAFLWNPVVLDSEEASRQRDLHEEQQERKRTRSTRHTEQEQRKAALDADIADRIRNHLEAFGAGNLDAWVRINIDISYSDPAPDGTVQFHQNETNIRQLRPWNQADAETHRRLIAAAEHFLRTYVPVQEWIRSDTHDWRIHSGYRALVLLYTTDPAVLESLENTVWQHWASTVIGTSVSLAGNADQHHRVLVAHAYQRAPEPFLRMFCQFLEPAQPIWLLHRTLNAVRDIWDARLATAALSALEAGRNRPLNEEITLLTAIMEHIQDLADRHELQEQIRARTERSVLDFLNGTDEPRDRAMAMARILLNYIPHRSWNLIWRALNENIEFGKNLIEDCSFNIYRYGGIGRLDHLSDDQVAALYRWIAEQYPRREDPQIRGDHATEPRERVSHARDAALNYLMQRGTTPACAAIEGLQQALPEDTWLNQVLKQARRLTRQQTWHPPSPRAILALTGDSRTRLVESASELLEVVEEGLQHIQARLVGETPEAPFLWNKIADRIWRPKDEEEFSNYIANRLRDILTQRGIVIGREVQIRRGQGSAPGQDTDIHVDAVRTVAGNAFDTVSVIIEAKGCWHNELDTAMATQLVGRYLQDNLCRHGIYLVGWFTSPMWDPDDSRRERALRMQLPDVRERLSEQAAQLSSNGILVKAVVLDIPRP